MNQLDILDKHRDDLLLAEAIGWLHDYRKCSDELLSGGGLPRPYLLRNVPALSDLNLSISGLGLTEAIEPLLHNWKKRVNGSTASQLLQYLSRCHNTAHFDKQEPVDGTPNYPIVQISSPFGFGVDIPINLTDELWRLPWSKLAHYSVPERQKLQKAVAKLFSKTTADTRHPINEVDLWSWGMLVGALYKSTLAGVLLTGITPVARDLRWRLLGLRVNGLDYLLNAARIPDLLAKQDLLADGLNKARELLEVTYPLGSEVYRDENGSIYVAPDVPDLLDRTDAHGASLRALILQAFAQGTVKGKPNLQLGGEIMPHLELEQRPWWGQDPDWKAKEQDKSSQLYGQKLDNELPSIAEFLAQNIVLSADPHQMTTFWQGGRTADICTVCGLRPQGPGSKAKDRNVCDICEERRADRSQRWATSQTDRTIWNDEVADVNGRMALIIGQFDLRHWLDGSLLETLFVIAPHDPENTSGSPVTSKMPSFSRLRRIWETTRTFWNEVQTEILQYLSDDRRRLKIYLNGIPRLGRFHAYDLALGASELSVVWVPPENTREGYLVSIDNLCYLARQLDAEADIYNDSAAAAIFVEDYLRAQFVRQSRQPILYNSDAPAGREKKNLIKGLFIRGIGYQTNQYATAIPILAEPRSFIMLVPADQSLAILQRIKRKYKEEMGKVRNRLPIHLGCVYAHRRAPIHAVLDAGRAMFSQRTTFQPWLVKSLNHPQTGAEDLELELEHNGYCIRWQVSLKMRDGSTEDRWYPYIFLETSGDDQKADASNRRAFKALRPDGNGKTVDFWIVHAADLRPGETIYLMPSTFDFLWLDAASRRFEIHYDDEGRRPSRPSRPFYLEDLDRLESLWGLLSQLTRTQLKQLLSTIETARERWFGRDQQRKSTEDKIFRQFVADALANAQWPKARLWKDIPAKLQDQLITAGARGELADLAELHLEILKEKNKGDTL